MNCRRIYIRFATLASLSLAVAADCLEPPALADDPFDTINSQLDTQKFDYDRDANKSKQWDLLPVAGAIQRNSDREAAPKDMDQLFGKMTELLGIPETSRLYRPFKRHFDKTAPHKKAKTDKLKAKQDEEMTQAWTTDASLLPFTADLPILVHYRGRFGIDLPSADQVWNPASLVSKDQFKEKLEALVPQLKQLADKELRAPEIPNCTESRTEKERISKRKLSKEEKSDQILDLVFINKRDVPFDYEEAFGRRAVIRGYQPGSIDGMSYYIEKLGIKCLPYRIRATREFRFQDWGMNALKNYDSDPDGKGEVSPLIENKAISMGYSWKK